MTHQVVNNQSAEIHSFDILNNSIDGNNRVRCNVPESLNLQTANIQLNSNVQSEHSITMGGGNFVNSIINGTLQNQDSFGNWINHIIADSPCSVDDSGLESSVSSVQDSYSSRLDDGYVLDELPKVVALNAGF